MAKTVVILFFFSILILSGEMLCASTDSFRVHSDLPYINKDEILLLDVFYFTDSFFTGSLDIRLYKYEASGDSVLVLSGKRNSCRFKTGLNKIRISFDADDTNAFCAQRFYQILNRVGNMPPGPYVTYISVGKNSSQLHHKYLHDVDSVLKPTSSLRGSIDKSLVHSSKSFLGINLGRNNRRATAHAGIAIANARNKTDKAIQRRGMVSKRFDKGDKTFIDLYYQDWFVGRYPMANKKSIGLQIQQQKDLAETKDLKSATTNNLGSPSLFSQYKTLNREKRDKDEIKGDLSLSTNLSNGQEQYSDVDNNYYQIQGLVEMPLLGIPVQIEALYTSQDNHRKIKSSYFKVHYNVTEMKENLLKTIGSYNTKFSETLAKGTGTNHIYQSVLNSLETQKENLLNEINSGSLGISTDENAAKAFAEDAIENTATTDSTSEPDSSGASNKEKANNAKKQAIERQKQIENKRKQIAELDKKIEKYRVLLEQNKNTNFFDSSVAYAKTSSLNYGSDLTYKKLAKKGSDLLPDGKAKSVLSGLTTLDAGMFSKYESKYTMSGQMIKGLDVGYDIGFSEVGATIGKTEYVGRDGSLDKYTCYSGRAVFKLVNDHTAGIVYYGYTADKKVFQGDGFFNSVNVSAPGFFQPVHIVSVNYKGSIAKHVTVNSEVASSFKNSDEKNTPKHRMQDRMAYHLNAEGNIPGSTVSLESSYDKTGNDFENNTLPVGFKGTEQYRVAGHAGIFHSLLTFGIEYNRLLQTNLSNSGSNTKWGFDIATGFKRYPNLSLSYKPFTTVRSYSDTLAIPQHPMIGSVWTGKATYHFKIQKRVYNFLLLYNNSKTIADSVQSGSTLAQATFMYSGKALSGNLSVGYMDVVTAIATPDAPGKTSFLALAASYAFNKQTNIIFGQDFGLSAFGFSKYACTGGLTYKPSKSKISLRVNARLNSFKLKSDEHWKQLYTGNIEMTYRFATKLKDH